MAEEPHESLDVLGRRCQEELLAHELQPPQAQATHSDLILQFREQGFDLLSLPLCMGELWRVRQLSGALSGRLMNVNGEIFISSIGALCFLGAGSAAFGAADIGMGMIANVQPHIVQLLSCRTTVAVAFGQISKLLWAITGIVFS